MTQAGLVGKIVAEGTLTLQSPLLIGSGNSTSDNDIDINVLKNKDGIPFLPGTSLTGVLRAFMERESPECAEQLFGSADDMKDDSGQSMIILHDIPLTNSIPITRDGVSIDPLTGTAMKAHKFDYEAVSRDAEGPFRMIITLRQIHTDENGCLMPEMEKAINHLLQKIASGFQLGAHGSTGLGQVKVQNLEKYFYDFRDKNSVVSWLMPENKNFSPSKTTVKGNVIPFLDDDFVVEAEFALPYSLIIRDYKQSETISKGQEQVSIHAVSLKENGSYVIPGSSWKGSLRQRAGYILNTLGKSQALVSSLMGPSPQEVKANPDKKWKGRFQVKESLIRPDCVEDTPQSRIRIDRFTGGTIDSALFTVKPLWGKENDAIVKLQFQIENALDYEAGLALCLLKDLWLGKLAIGGEKSIGRGILHGKKIVIHYKGKHYQIEEGKDVDADTEEALNGFVKELVDWKEREINNE